MDRRGFIGTTVALTAAAAAHGSVAPLPRRPYKDGIELSVIALGGIVVCGLSQEDANRRVAVAYDRGVNYFDCAPSYFDGEAELKLGEALKPYRNKVFLAEKPRSAMRRALVQSWSAACIASILTTWICTSSMLLLQWLTWIRF